MRRFRHVRPTRAERARTTLATAAVLDVFARGLLVAVSDHRVDAAGTVELDVLEDSRLVDVLHREGGAVPVLVRAARVSTRPCPDRASARVELLGRMTDHRRSAGGRILRIAPTHVSVDELVVPLRHYRRAVPDPLAPCEADELDALARRPGVLDRLCRLAGADPGAVDPVGVDRYGLTLRITGPCGTADHRLPFPCEVRTRAELDRVLHDLLGGR